MTETDELANPCSVSVLSRRKIYLLALMNEIDSGQGNTTRPDEVGESISTSHSASGARYAPPRYLSAIWGAVVTTVSELLRHQTF